MEPAASPSPRPGAIRPRHAASLLVLRPDGAVLMGLRGAGHRFMPNRLVFPGGAVDTTDATAPLARPLAPETAALLGKAAPPRLARALAHAAARELEEETGLSLGSPPDLAPLSYLCRAVTPPASPVRFNARFLVVDATHVSGTLAGSGELEDLRWLPIAEAMALDLAWVTRGVLGHLCDWMRMAPAERAARARTPVCRARNWTEE